MLYRSTLYLAIAALLFTVYLGFLPGGAAPAARQDRLPAQSVKSSPQHRPSTPGPVFQQQRIFEAGQGGYAYYRIPALLATAKGTVLAFCEARKNSVLDDGDIDVVVRRSADGGRTWGAMTILADAGEGWMGSPTPMQDRTTGEILLLYTRLNQHLMLRRSRDEGQTWSEPENLPDSLKLPNWAWLIPGPGHAIQLRSGRLLVPGWAQLYQPTGHYVSLVLYSDDHGRTWQRGGVLDANASNECQVVELSDGRLYMTLRVNRKADKFPAMRGYSFSADGGATWTPVQLDPRLPDPVPLDGCEGSVLSVQRAGLPPAVLLSHAASTEDRAQLTVRLSTDNAKSWPAARTVDDLTSAWDDPDWDKAAYSDLAQLPGGDVLMLSESARHRRMILTRFNLAWLQGANPDRVVLFDEDAEFSSALNQISYGAGDITWTTADRFSGQGSVRLVPHGRYNTRVRGWRYPVRRNPGPGEYRYLRVAWKSAGATSLGLELASDGKFSLKGYQAGPPTSWNTRRVAEQAPTGWEEMTFDLGGDNGDFTLTGISLLAANGPAFFDRCELLRHLPAH